MNRTALVTGAAGGIGSAICRHLADLQWSIAAVDLSPKLADLVEDLEKRGAGVHPIEANLTTDAGLTMVETTIANLPPLRLLVNNAGITRDARLINMSDEEFGSVLDVNLGAPLNLITRLAPRMDEGAIVNVTSRTLLGNFGQFNYTLAKGALVGVTRAFALSLAPRIRVNAVAPGLINTEMAMAMPADVRQRIIGSIPSGRMGEASEIAAAVAFLADHEYITGSVYFVDGGRSLSR